MTRTRGKRIISDLMLRGLHYQPEIILKTLDIINQTLNGTMKIPYTSQVLNFSKNHG